MVYLNDGYTGGNTQFHYYSKGLTTPAHSLVPALGTVVIFNHDIWYVKKEMTIIIKCFPGMRERQC